MNKLAIGSGGKKVGWFCIDANPKSGADLICMIPPLPEEVTNKKWDRIEMIHVIEHFYLWEAKQLLTSIRNILSEGGYLYMEQPNIKYCAEVLLGKLPPNTHHKGQFDMWGFYGDPNHKDPLMCHKWGYTPGSMTELLVECGFGRTEKTEVIGHSKVRDFALKAWR